MVEEAKTQEASAAPADLKASWKWYVIHTYSGYEQKAKAALEERVRSMHMEHKIGAVLVPVERVQELGKGGQRKISSRKFFPGYIFVNMLLDDETWHVIKNTPKITGFVGHATNPPEVPEHEVKEITQQMEEGALRPKPKVLVRSRRGDKGGGRSLPGFQRHGGRGEAGKRQGAGADFDFWPRNSGRTRFRTGRESVATIWARCAARSL